MATSVEPGTKHDGRIYYRDDDGADTVTTTALMPLGGGGAKMKEWNYGHGKIRKQRVKEKQVIGKPQLRSTTE